MPRGVVANELDWDIIVGLNTSSSITFHFGLMASGKAWTLYSRSYGLDNTTTILLQGWLWYYITHEGWYAITQRNQTNPLWSLSLSFTLYFSVFLYVLWFLDHLSLSLSLLSLSLSLLGLSLSLSLSLVSLIFWKFSLGIFLLLLYHLSLSLSLSSLFLLPFSLCFPFYFFITSLSLYLYLSFNCFFIFSLVLSPHLHPCLFFLLNAHLFQQIKSKGNLIPNTCQMKIESIFFFSDYSTT